MFITDAQKTQIRVWLSGLQVRSDWMLSLSSRADAWEQEFTWYLAAERALHTSCEYMTDVASLVIDALVMRDPGGYADIVKVLVEENVLDATWFANIEGVFEVRSQLLRDHATITPQQVRQAIRRYSPLFPEFKVRIEGYLKL